MTTDGSVPAWELLGDPSRRSIVVMLADHPLPVGELADRLPISRPAVSQHLRVLKDAGLVVDEVHGTRRLYRVDPVALSALRDQLDTFWRRTLEGFSDTAQDSAQSSTPRRSPRRAGQSRSENHE